MLARLLLIAVLVGAAMRPAGAQPVTIVSAAPDGVALTIYRAPYSRGAIDLRSLDGFALVTETRRIRLPRGTAIVRFEGVAKGIIPVSAIIDGLPGGVIEKNRDARLLSPASLIDGSLGSDVTLTRTDRTTGKRTSETATIVAGPIPGVVLRTAAGIEALRCSGLPEQLTFGGVPRDLSSKPVLSVTTTSAAARTVIVRVTYLSTGFDWRASYVATLGADEGTLDLFAWMTLANGNPTAFADAEVQAVAGRLNRVWTPPFATAVSRLRLICYPHGTTTSDLHERHRIDADEIIVTGSRVFVPMPVGAPPAPPPPPPPPPPPEDLGDLKLYHVPARTTVAANGQKQVALLARTGVAFERRYRRSVYPRSSFRDEPTSIELVLKNEKATGLGMPLPAGDTALYAQRGSARLLLGLGTMADRAIGETTRLDAGVSEQVRVTQEPTASEEATLTVANANPFPVTLDVPIGAAGQKIEQKAGDGTLAQRDGVAVWAPVVPARGQATLRYGY